jgi:hypothetical protein
MRPIEALAGVVVGLIWGFTNPLIKRGSAALERRKVPGDGAAAEWRALLSTPSFLVPQLLNQVGPAGVKQAAPLP